MKYIIFTDGGARGNPGPAAGAFVIVNGNSGVVSEGGKFLGETTNNFAEYSALIMALETAAKVLPKDAQVDVNMDSELAVRQLIGKYKIKDEKLKILASEVIKKCKNFSSVSFHHIPREKNAKADALVNKILDENLAGM